MSKPLIPMSPEGFSTPLNRGEQLALNWYVLSGCSRMEAYLLFARPDMAQSKAKSVVEATVRQFFARKEVRDYIDAYTDTIQLATGVKKKPVSVTSAPLEDRRAEAKRKVIDFALQLADNIQDASDPESVMKICDKIGLLDSIEVDELPRRYLPVSCSACAYRQFCEDNTEDMCQYCKALRIAINHGFVYDPATLLDSQNGTDIAKTDRHE